METTIVLHRIETAGDSLLERLTPLYLEAFPPDERRDAGQLARVIERRPRAHFHAILERDEPVGLLGWWELREFYYLEHLAVFPHLRRRSIGARALQEIARRLVGTRLLEVEPPVDDASARRVAWYERNGYRVLDSDYVQPPYDGKGTGRPLWIMGNERPARLPEFIERLKREVYRENEHV
ncbi:MAG: GNAT family N-acetyltransferase [Odoribacteraceae bacterium]|nr:GNAT family N-acetyltransferase [Odoribacteraceae bacterium]